MYLKQLLYLMLFVCVGCAVSGKVAVTDRLGEYEKSNNDVIIFGEIGPKVPDGYDLIGKGSFESGPLTLKCGKGTLDQEAVKQAKEIGADAVKYFDLKQPNYILNTCYKSKILFLRKQVE